MQRKYMIMRKSGASGGAGLAYRSLESFGAGEPALRVADLDEQQAGEVAADPDLDLTAVMPTQLIAPLEIDDGAAAAVLDGGDTAWGIAAVGADRSPYDGRKVRVAVLDTGIASDHPAFAHADIREEDFTGEGNGDKQGHGTHCAGTIFGKVDGQRIGVAPGITDVRIGKVLGSKGRGTSDMVFSALHWAVEQKVNIISMSLGFDFPGMVADQVKAGWPPELATSIALEAYRSNLRMFDAIMAEFRARAAFGNAPLVIAAAGNESRRAFNPDFRIAASLPAAAEGVVSVAALRQSKDGLDVADFSNIHAKLAAPGHQILSAKPDGSLVLLSGTSMACPHVAGVAALWWQALGGKANPERVSARLLATCTRRDLGGVGGTDIGEGLVQAPLAEIAR